jgi:hypothetical protein
MLIPSMGYDEGAFSNFHFFLLGTLSPEASFLHRKLSTPQSSFPVPQS